MCAQFLRLHVSYLIFLRGCRIGMVTDIHNLAVSDVPIYYTRNALAHATARQMAVAFDMQVASVRHNAIPHRILYYFNYC